MLGDTIQGWAKELGRIGKAPSPMERHAGRAMRKERKADEHKRKIAAKMFKAEKSQARKDE